MPENIMPESPKTAVAGRPVTLHTQAFSRAQAPNIGLRHRRSVVVRFSRCRWCRFMETSYTRAASEKPREKRQGRAISCRPVAAPPPPFFFFSLIYSSRSKHTSLVCRLPHPPPDHVFSETEKKKRKNEPKEKKKNRTDTRAAQSLFRDCGNAVVRVTGSHTYTCTDLVSSQSCCPLPALRADMRKRSGVQILRARVVG